VKSGLARLRRTQRQRLLSLRLPRRTIRLRLTAVYAVLFLLSGIGLLSITYLLVEHDTSPQVLSVRSQSALGPVVVPGGLALPPAGATTLCYTTSIQPLAPSQATQCVGYLRAEAGALRGQVERQRADYLNTLLIGSGVALAAMTLIALGLGWLVSGRALSPLRTITRTARNISASNLHERLGLGGPDDELKELGDTVDGLLARLEGSFAAQRQFVANASHELRTPLARQRTLVEVALADPDRTVESLDAACRRVLAAGQQQERLIEGLLTLARSQRGLDQFEPVDLAALTTELVLSRAPDARLRDIELTAVTGPAFFPGDDRLAERLISNLLDNAIRHNQAGGAVRVSTATAAGQAVLSVTNTGPVIHEGEVPALLEPFRRRGSTRTSGGDSTGLGLSIVAAIAAAHGAGLWVWAPPEGGLEVQVRFSCEPVAAGALTGAATAVIARPPGAADGPAGLAPPGPVPSLRAG
jgi:signal transduction histidine kinase